MPSLCHTQVITAKMELNNFNVQLPLQGAGFYCHVFCLIYYIVLLILILLLHHILYLDLDLH